MPFGLGPAELMIVMIIAVLLFGKNLPSVGRSLGKSLMEFKKGLNDIKSEMDAAVYSEPASTTGRSADRYRSDEYDEPTAPKFEPPTQEPVESSRPSDSATA